MNRIRRPIPSFRWIVLWIAAATFLSAENLSGDDSNQNASADKHLEADPIRIATFNVSLYGKRPGEIRSRLAGNDDAQAKRIASIVQTVRPDILLLNEIDFAEDFAPAKRLAENYFAVGQPEATGVGRLNPIDFPFLVSLPSNTGVDSDLDLDGDGRLETGNDAWGYGVYPGQYAMTVMSRFPIDRDSIRTFQYFRWSAFPGAARPVHPQTGESFYSDAIWNRLRLSSKNHADVPIRVGDRVLHLLVSHPTPPVFDGPEDRNGARNHDEISFWIRYIDADPATATWLVDDAGRRGGLSSAEAFVIAGDLNADPVDGSGRREAIQKLLSHRRVNDIRPAANSDRQPVAGRERQRTKTADFGRNGRMRVDYVLPSRNLDTIGGGVFWPSPEAPGGEWISASDHRMVWIDIDGEGAAGE